MRCPARARLSAIAGLAAVVLTVALGCGAGDASIAASPATPPRLSFPRPLPADALAAFQYTGGIAGFDQLLIIRRGGQASVDPGHGRASVSFRLAAGVLARLRRELARAALARVASAPPKPCCDQIDIWLYGSGYAVRNPPAADHAGPVATLISDLQAILTRHAGFPG